MNPELDKEVLQRPKPPEALPLPEQDLAFPDQAPGAQLPQVEPPNLDIIRGYIAAMPDADRLPEPSREPSTSQDLKPPHSAPTPGSPATRLLESTRQAAAAQAYAYLGDRTPAWIMKHVPVYRAVGKQHAGLPGVNGRSEWAIGSGAKKNALEWVADHAPNPNEPDVKLSDEEYVAIQSTLGQLTEYGTPKVTHYGDYHSTKRKVVLEHATPEVAVKHRVIKSNKS